MKKTLLISAAILSCAIASNADTMNIGYAEGKPISGTPIGLAYGDRMDIESAIYLPQSTVQLLGGKTIKGINGCITSSADIETVYIFIRQELEGENLAEFKLVPNQLHNVKRGINKLTFKQPYIIPEDLGTGLYIGFGYIMKDANARGLAASDTAIPGGFFLRRRDGKWYDFSDRGTAAIEAVIEGDNLPVNNLRLSRVDTPEALVMTKGSFAPTFYIHNFGSNKVSAFDLVAEIEGSEVSRTRVQRPINPNEMAICTLEISPEIKTKGDKEVTYRIENPEEGNDPDMADNTLTDSFEAVPRDYPRYVLSEEFTTEKCGSCPPVVSMIHDLLQKPEYSNVIQVAHHAGYKTDHLTLPMHQTYESLYGGGTFAPGLCVDRTPTDPVTVVFFPEDEDAISKQWDKSLQNPALVSVDIHANYTDDTKNKLAITVSGEKSSMHLCDSPTVTVWLVEDNIASRSQAGANRDFIHNHVTRACGSADPWGDALTFDADNYKYTCTIDLDKEWNPANMHIVAFVGNNGKWNQKEVKNAARISFAEIKDSGIEETVSNRQPTATEYFDLSGRQISGPVSGIYLQRTTFSDGTVTTSKKVVK